MDDAGQALARMAALLAERGYYRHLKKNEQTIDAVIAAFRTSPDSVNIVRCLLEQARALPEPARLRDADVQRLTESEPYPLSTLSREIIAALANGSTLRPHMASTKSVLFLIHLMVEADHPAMARPIIRALITALPELRIFALQQTPGEIANYLRRQRGEGLYTFMGNANLQASLQASISSTLLSELDCDDASIAKAQLTAVRPSARGPRGGSGFLISRVTLEVTKAGREPYATKYIHTLTERGKGKKVQIRSTGLVVPNSGNDIYLIQYQNGLGSFNISAFPQEQTSMPGGFARGLILTYDAQNNEGIMATRIALFKGVPSHSDMISDASWNETKKHLQLIPDVDVNYDEVLRARLIIRAWRYGASFA